MRPTGELHLGHYHGALKNWVRLQADYECFYFVADWHALTTHYEDREVIEKNVYDMVIDWLAAGLDPERATIFIQSRLPEHAELFTLLSMGTPLGWLERMPTYKDQIERLKDRDLATYGFLGYPLLQAADILIYRAAFVPVGEDQSSHVEITREVARRFNHLYGREPNFEALAEATVKKMGKSDAKTFEAARKAFRQDGDESAHTAALAPDREERGAVGCRSRAADRLLSRHRPEHPDRAAGAPHRGQEAARARRREDEQELRQRHRDARRAEGVEQKVRRMQTDPKRVRRTDPGNPEDCPVWQFHLVYSDQPTRDWVVKGCTTAGIGCLECKQPVIDAIQREQQPWRERAEQYLSNPKQVHWIVEVGTERARTIARQTMRDVRTAMGLAY
jgi:tryptophanyl-tRNA synthetase